MHLQVHTSANGVLFLIHRACRTVAGQPAICTKCWGPCPGTYEELVVSMVKGVPLQPPIARDTAAAILETALDEEDISSQRCVSLGRMLRCGCRTEACASIGHVYESRHVACPYAWLDELRMSCACYARRVLNRKHSSAVDAAVNAMLTDGGAAAKSGPGAAARQQRLLPLLRMGLAGSAGAPLPNSITTLRLAVDAVSPAARIVVRLRSCSLLSGP
jgi:hypothetical protein